MFDLRTFFIRARVLNDRAAHATNTVAFEETRQLLLYHYLIFVSTTLFSISIESDWCASIKTSLSVSKNVSRQTLYVYYPFKQAVSYVVVEIPVRSSLISQVRFLRSNYFQNMTLYFLKYEFYVTFQPRYVRTKVLIEFLVFYEKQSSKRI